MDHTTARPGPAEAARLLDQADRIGRRAHDAVRWPYVTFITALGVATSLGTLGMGLTTGTRSPRSTSAPSSRCSPWWCSSC
ncbi:hypothetical protein Q9Q99_08050 [Curtobacterium flaccumfaciens]|nr:hypothetical protein Q9Q99_08050 [Curtobacterium flaccumfaciens]